LQRFPILNFLHLEQNNLTGSIPVSFAGMENLNFLYINDNQLSGSYPSNIKPLCELLNNSDDANMSDGNNFNQSWESFCFDGGEVWPGDLNNDGYVDEEDAAFWGQTFNNTGPARASNHQNIDWYAHPAEDWLVDANGINGKHQDADGNGVVDGDDLAAVSENEGRSNGNGSIAQSIEPGELNFRVERQLTQGNILPVRLFVEDLQGADILAHGISGVISFDNPAVTNATIDIASSSLNPNSAYVFDQYNSNNNRLAFAITRTNGIDKLCDGYVLTIKINIALNATNDEINMQFTKGKVILSNGQSKNINNANYRITISGINNNVTLSATSYIIQPGCNSLGKAIIVANGGMSPYYYEWNTGVTDFGASTHTYNHLLPGAYDVTVTDSNGDSQTLSIIITALEPVYDVNGELICGTACEAFINPTGNVSTGTIQAKQLIVSDAKIQQNTNAEFTAGERIRLSTGFSTKPNATFRAAIEDCE